MNKFQGSQTTFYVRNKRKTKEILILFFLIFCFLVVSINACLTLINEKKNQRKYQSLIEQYASEFSLDEALVYAVILCESDFKSDAVSNAGASGLMQIMPSTFSWICTKLDLLNADIFDPETNIMVGCWYLSYLCQKFESIETVLAAYNAGEGTVQEWLDDNKYSDDGINLKNIPYSETKYYVFSVTKAMKSYKK